MSTQWKRQLSRYVSKVIECLEQNIRKQIDNKKDYQVQNKWTNYKIFELKYGNTKLLGNTNHNQVKLVLAVFRSAYLYQYSSKSHEASAIQLVSNITLDLFYLDKHLTIK